MKNLGHLIRKVDQLFTKWDNSTSPGCALGIVKNGEMIYDRGYGMADLELGDPITSKTVFYICSTSKQFTATCIHLLAHRGLIALDDSIRRFVPELSPSFQRVTIRDLLHHTSGIRDYFDLMDIAGMDVSNVHSDSVIIDLLKRQEGLTFTPGERFSYSNSGYFLLSVVVERSSRRTLRQFAEEEIFGPLSMARTHFHDNWKMGVPNRAKGYDNVEDGFRTCQTKFDRVGSGGLMATVEDLFRWDQNFYRNRLGKAAIIRDLLTPGKLNFGEPLNYASGLYLTDYKGLQAIHHAGRSFGFTAELIRFPRQEFSVICLANASAIDSGNLARQVADIFLADAFEFKEYVGRYYCRELRATYKLISRQGNLVMTHGTRGERLLQFKNRDQFEVSDITSGTSGKLHLQFVRDQWGRVAGLNAGTRTERDIPFIKSKRT